MKNKEYRRLIKLHEEQTAMITEETKKSHDSIAKKMDNNFKKLGEQNVVTAEEALKVNKKQTKKQADRVIKVLFAKIDESREKADKLFGTTEILIVTAIAFVLGCISHIVMLHMANNGYERLTEIVDGKYIPGMVDSAGNVLTYEHVTQPDLQAIWFLTIMIVLSFIAVYLMVKTAIALTRKGGDEDE